MYENFTNAARHVATQMRNSAARIEEQLKKVTLLDERVKLKRQIEALEARAKEADEVVEILTNAGKPVS